MITLYDGIDADGLYPTDPVLFRYSGGECTVFVRRILCCTSAELILYSDETGETVGIDAVYDGICGDRDAFKAVFSPSSGLYYAAFRLTLDDGEYFVHSTGDETHGILRAEISECGRFQLLYTEEYARVDPVFAGANMYHIFVDRFFKSGKSPRRGDAVYFDDWYNDIPEYTEYPGMEMENNSFFGGDLYGVTEKLRYLYDLGTDIIYMSPIFEAYSNHRYDVGDFMRIDASIGGDGAFAELCERAHSLGMRVIIDGVFNHTGNRSVYFNQFKKYGEGGAYNDPDSEYRDWYYFKEWPDDYECWWGVKALPKLDQDNPAVFDLICGEHGVIKKYLRRGADGFRLDVADELTENLLDGIKRAAQEEKPGAVVIGEVWEDASNKISYGKRRHYFSHAQLDGVMDYPLRDAVITYVKTGDAGAITKALTLINTHYPAHVKNFLMNFLGSHDTERIMTVLGGDPANDLPGSVLAAKRMTKPQYVLARRRFLLAFSLLCFCPGIVSVYYGDEAGMQGYRDPFNRMPFPWGYQDTQITDAVRKLLKLRKNLSGDVSVEYAGDGILILKRDGHVFASNVSDKKAEIFLGGYYRDTDGNTYADTVVVPPLGHYILRKETEQPNDQIT